MNEYVKIKADIDDKTKKKIKQLLKDLKKSQDKTVEKVAVILLENLDENSAIILSDDALFAIRSEITDTMNELNISETEFLNAVLENGYNEAFTKTAAKIGSAIDFNLVKSEFVARALNSTIDGKRFSDRVWENTNNLANRIYNDILECVKIGVRPNAVAKKIKDDFGVSAYQAVRLVNTELARVVSDAQLDAYKNSGVVDKVLYTATLEHNTCETCADLDGKIFNLNEAPKIPQHPNCRCCYIPIVDDYIPTKRADNETMQVIDYKTFNNWK